MAVCKAVWFRKMHRFKGDAPRPKWFGGKECFLAASFLSWLVLDIFSFWGLLKLLSLNVNWACP